MLNKNKFLHNSRFLPIFFNFERYQEICQFLPDFNFFTDLTMQVVFFLFKYCQQFQQKTNQHFLFCFLLFFSHLNPLKQLPENNVLIQFGTDCPVLAGESERMSIYNQICFEVPLSHNATVIFVLDSMKKMKFG